MLYNGPHFHSFCQVALGNPADLKQANSSLSSAPKGFDCTKGVGILPLPPPPPPPTLLFPPPNVLFSIYNGFTQVPLSRILSTRCLSLEPPSARCLSVPTSSLASLTARFSTMSSSSTRRASARWSRSLLLLSLSPLLLTLLVIALFDPLRLQVQVR